MDYLTKLHSELVDIMDFIDDVCRRNNIVYYLTAGTLLGAVRHKGFIPWDDDLDIAMPRNEYERFIEIINKGESEEYSILTVNDDSYPNYFSKLQKKGTVYQEGDDSNWGIFVDIFPLDDTKKKSFLLKVRKQFFNFSVFSRRRIIAENRSNYMLYSISKLFSVRTWGRFADKAAKAQNNKGFCYYSNFGSQYDIYKQTMPKEWFGKGKYIEFENKKFCVPEDYDRILVSIYGKKYMEIPPEDRRITHHPDRIVFSDGEEFSSEKDFS